MDIEDIKKNYENFDDDKLIKLATKEINSLREEFIPILKAELKKRNLSTKSKKTYSKEQFENPLAKEKLFYSDEHIQYFKSNENSLTKSENGKVFFINNGLSFLISTLFTIITIILLKSIIGSRLILFAIIITFIFKFVLSKLNIGKIAEFTINKVIISKYPIGNFNIFRIFILFQIALNGLKKIEINYKSILKIYQKNDLFDKGYYIDFIDNMTGNLISHRVFLEALSKNDKSKLLKILKSNVINRKTLPNNQ